MRLRTWFPGVVALDRVDLSIADGKKHALAVENGAGKSSLIRRFGFVDRRTLDREAEALLARVGLDEVSPRTKVERPGIAQMQLLEIARALSRSGRVLDEPTATLTPWEAGRLFEQLHALKAVGMTMIYVSHHLGEVFSLCDRVTVLRNGAKVGTWRTADSSPGELVRQMIGRTLAAQPPLAGVALGGEALRIEGLRPLAAPPGAGLGLSVRYGEILGLAGLVGAGRTETVRAIFGADPRRSGRILRDGAPVDIRSPREATRHGICLLTENRKEEGLVLSMATRVNVTLAHLRRANVAAGLACTRRGSQGSMPNAAQTAAASATGF